MELTFDAIGTIRSCHTDKFGVPRQPGLAPSATAVFEPRPPYDRPEAFRGIEAFSHVWIQFVFHATARAEWKPTVRPPRLGGNERVGVFASRSNFRPNPIGLSVVKLLAVDGATLTLGGGDFLDGTPVLDIKPYLPYADAVSDARGAFASTAPERTNRVVLAEGVGEKLAELETAERPNLRRLIEEMLAFNPRPAYQNDATGRVYGTTVFDVDVRWTQTDDEIRVIAPSAG